MNPQAYTYPHKGSMAMYKEPKPKKEVYTYPTKAEDEFSEEDYNQALKYWQKSLIGYIKEPEFKVGDIWYHIKTGIKGLVSKNEFNTINSHSHYHPGQKVDLKDFRWVEEVTIIEFEGLKTEIDQLDDIMHVTFGRSMKVKFEKQGEDYIAINGMDGWGNNNVEEIRGKKATLSKEWQPVEEPEKWLIVSAEVKDGAMPNHEYTSFHAKKKSGEVQLEEIRE